ncbi:MAG TPA: hypothetical protein VMA73_23955 [Streptosporangiaceae bacterium]|nr:hypothetical protein [Streptosporangiaceae bacterium]
MSESKPDWSDREAIAAHQARRRQRALDRLREAAKTSDSARKLLDLVDPRGDLRFCEENQEKE